MGTSKTVTVFGAYGHTGRFVVAELLERGFIPILAGRDEDKLKAIRLAHPKLETRLASVDNPLSLSHALKGADAVINCAGPFASTASSVLEAALRAGVPYVDIAAEIEAVVDLFAQFERHAYSPDAIAVPSMAFFGGLGDLLVTSAMGDWTAADEVHIAYWLSSWHPTTGTRAASKVSRRRRNGQRVRYAEGQLEYRDDDPPRLEWSFPAPLGSQPVLGEFATADVVTIPRHLSVAEIQEYVTVKAIEDVSASDPAAPIAVDKQGRSGQTFLIDVIVRANAIERRIVANGQDIYAVSAPLAVEAIQRVLDGQIKTTGIASAGEIFDAPDFLCALSPHISLLIADQTPHLSRVR